MPVREFSIPHLTDPCLHRLLKKSKTSAPGTALDAAVHNQHLLSVRISPSFWANGRGCKLLNFVNYHTEDVTENKHKGAIIKVLVLKALKNLTETNTVLSFFWSSCSIEK